MFRKRKSTISQYFETEQVAWERDKNILSLNASDDRTISIGYATHSLEDYQELVPFVLDVAAILLKDCTVFTWLKTPTTQTDVSHSLWPHKAETNIVLCNLAAQYASENHPDSFSMEAAKSSQKRRGLIECSCNDFFKFRIVQQFFSTRFTGFMHPQPSTATVPMKIFCFPLYTHSAISYENFHVEFIIQFNPSTVLESTVLEQIHQICRSHGKELV